jgi:predicted outer membrane repeat protein
MHANGAGASGGGMYTTGGSLTLNNVLINWNSAYSNGGGLYEGGGTVIVSGGSFQDNSAESNGGGIYNADGGKLTLQNGVIIGTNNSASFQGGGLYLAIGSVTTFSGCTVKGNQASVGVGVYQETDAQGTATVNYRGAGLTDNDDPGGKPVQGA